VLERERGIVGTPLLEVNTKFLKTVTYGETIQISSFIEEWRRVAFIQVHRVTRGDEVVCEGREVRAFVMRDPDDPGRMRAIPVPQDIRALCT
jgi:4-hydroxybenzoyl-CoA thioesterase